MLIRRSFSPVAPVKTQRPPQLSERDTLALCIQPSLCVWGRQERVRVCMCVSVRQCAVAAGEGKGREEKGRGGCSPGYSYGRRRFAAA